MTATDLFQPPWDDAPGVNLTLRPEAAPGWLRPVLGAGDHIDPTRRVDGKVASAVLVLLTGSSVADAEVVLTHRSPAMRSHSGQIAFPGGHVEAHDKGPVDTALREAWEEIGLDRREVTPLETWPAMGVRSKKRPVVPVIAHWDDPGEIGVASPAEADHVFTTPIAELADPANRVRVSFRQHVGPAFRVNDYVVWGFTASILDALLDAAGWSTPWGEDTPVDLYDTLRASRNHEKME